MDSPADAFYTGLVAETYSQLKSTSFPAERYTRLIEKFGEPALELGCGDGDPLLELRELGLDVDGVDSSPDMLARLRGRAERRGLEVNAWLTAMEAMVLPRRYRTVFLAGPTFNLLPTDDAMQEALHAIRGALASGGAAIIPLFVPPVARGEVGATTREQTPGGTVSCTVVAAARDEVQRTQRLTLRYERCGDGELETLERDWVLHWTDLARFEELAGNAGLRITSAPPAIGADPADVVLTRG
ncbi:MAG TPA: class I SAM-dependent methyltransferase [Beutenbergiaceae bacterium]|nr:class I SAM-dependent methyltransferase [Beutenbergiaceae bacterium]